MLTTFEAFDEPDSREKAAVSDNSDDFQRVTDVIEWVAVNQQDIRASTRRNAANRESEAQGAGRVDPRGSQHVFVVETGIGEGAKLCMGRDTRGQPVRPAAEDNRRRLRR